MSSVSDHFSFFPISDFAFLSNCKDSIFSASVEQLHIFFFHLLIRGNILTGCSILNYTCISGTQDSIHFSLVFVVKIFNHTEKLKQFIKNLCILCLNLIVVNVLLYLLGFFPKPLEIMIFHAIYLSMHSKNKDSNITTKPLHT